MKIIWRQVKDKPIKEGDFWCDTDPNFPKCDLGNNGYVQYLRPVTDIFWGSIAKGLDCWRPIGIKIQEKPQKRKANYERRIDPEL